MTPESHDGTWRRPTSGPMTWSRQRQKPEPRLEDEGEKIAAVAMTWGLPPRVALSAANPSRVAEAKAFGDGRYEWAP